MCVLLLATSPLHIYVSREARFYPAVVCLFLLTLYSLHQAIEERGQIKWWLGFTIVTVPNLYVHLTAFLVLAAKIAYAASLLLYLGRLPFPANRALICCISHCML